MVKYAISFMSVQTDRLNDGVKGQTDKVHVNLIYVRLTQACPNSTRLWENLIHDVATYRYRLHGYHNYLYKYI